MFFQTQAEAICLNYVHLELQEHEMRATNNIHQLWVFRCDNELDQLTNVAVDECERDSKH